MLGKLRSAHLHGVCISSAHEMSVHFLLVNTEQSSWAGKPAAAPGPGSWVLAWAGLTGPCVPGSGHTS